MATRRSFLRRTSAGATILAAAAGMASAVEAEKTGCLTDVEGIQVGHFTYATRPTGCTVVLFDQPATTGVDVRGSSPGTRETDLLNPLATVQQVNAILLAGGSAFGLDAATGVMRFLEERHRGFHVGRAVVPIVPAAVLFDLSVGDGTIRPDAEAGYKACQGAGKPVALGNVGAGAGATVGKLFGLGAAMKGGIGSASLAVGKSDLVIGAMVAVNAAGDIRDHQTGRILAGARSMDGQRFRGSIAELRNGATLKLQAGANSTIGIVATNASLTKAEATKVAQMAHDGFARSINPVHTAYDGDTIFASATGTSRIALDVSTAGALAAECMALAVENAVMSAQSIPGFPALRDLPKRFS